MWWAARKHRHSRVVTVVGVREEHSPHGPEFRVVLSDGSGLVTDQATLGNRQHFGEYLRSRGYELNAPRSQSAWHRLLAHLIDDRPATSPIGRLTHAIIEKLSTRQGNYHANDQR